MTVNSKSNPQSMVPINDIGQVQSISLPDTWILSETELPPGGNAFYLEYHQLDNPSVKFCFYYRGKRTTGGAALAFHKLLSALPHQLSADELNQPGIIDTMRIRDASKGFTVTSAHTKMITHKMVLIVEGYFGSTNEKPQQNVYAMYIDSDGTGSAVQEIYFQAKDTDYGNHLKNVTNALSEIRWKSKGQPWSNIDKLYSR